MLTYNKLKYKLHALLINNHLDFADQQTLICVYCIRNLFGKLLQKSQKDFLMNYQFSDEIEVLKLHIGIYPVYPLTSSVFN